MPARRLVCLLLAMQVVQIVAEQEAYLGCQARVDGMQVLVHFCTCFIYKTSAKYICMHTSICTPCSCSWHSLEIKILQQSSLEHDLFCLAYLLQILSGL